MEDKLKIETSEISHLLGTVGSPLIVISELIKNSVDAEAQNIMVSYNKANQQIQVEDDGIGMVEVEIKNITRPGFSSKKRDGKVKNTRGFYFTGSKGLGLLSCFSLCEKLDITTCSKEEGPYQVTLNKEGVLSYSPIENYHGSIGTVVTLVDIKEEVFDFLTSALELKKLRHISTYVYKKDAIKFPNIELKLGNSSPFNILTDIDFDKVVYDVGFNYNNKNKVMKFKCSASYTDKISNKQIELHSFDLGSLETTLYENYNVAKVIQTRANAEADQLSSTNFEDVPSFEGRILVYERRGADGKTKEYGPGVNIYINQFALYNYLSDENDWLDLADFSQRRKNTTLRPHNVYGYVNFPDFNENVEKLNISNERADFLQDYIYKKTMYLIKGAVMLLIFNIDVTYRDLIKKSSSESTHNNGLQNIKDNASKNQNAESDSDDNTESGQNNNSTQYNKDGNYSGGSDYYSSGNGEKDTGESENYNNDEDEYNDGYHPEDTYTPRSRKNRYKLYFTKEDWTTIETIRNTSDLGNKICHIAWEITSLDMRHYCCAISGLYRALLECSTRFIQSKYANEIVFLESNNLESNVINAVNYISNHCKGMDKDTKKWREVLTKRHLADILNDYMHKGSEVDIDFIDSTWRTMKSYFLRCIST